MRQFFHRSREWVRAKQETELFEMAATDLREFAYVDSGFFVYFTSPKNGAAAQKPSIYAPWGVFKHARRLQSIANQVSSFITERWVLTDDISSLELKTAFVNNGLLEVGIWPLVLRDVIFGAIVVAHTRPANRITDEMQTTVLHACAVQISMTLDLISTRRVAEESSQHDMLTGLLNRRGLESRLPMVVEWAENNSKFVVFGLLDLDDLKSINDSHGHPAGDQAIQQVAKIIKQSLRADDLVARFGGDEFSVVIASDKKSVQALTRIQAAVKEQSDGYSVSVGGAIWGVDGFTFEECYRIADERLYKDKRCKIVSGV